MLLMCLFSKHGVSCSLELHVIEKKTHGVPYAFALADSKAKAIFFFFFSRCIVPPPPPSENFLYLTCFCTACGIGGIAIFLPLTWLCAASVIDPSITEAVQSDDVTWWHFMLCDVTNFGDLWHHMVTSWRDDDLLHNSCWCWRSIFVFDEASKAFTLKGH